MNRPFNGTNSTTSTDRLLDLGVKVVVVVVVVVTVGAMSISMAPVADAQDGNETDSNESSDDSKKFAIEQGDTCYTVTPLGDEETNVVSYYDYRTHGSGYSSRGTTDLQVQDTSQFFFYEGNGGLSLVFLHDAFTGNRSEGGGAVTFVMRGMPVTGGWTVKDDGYAGANDSFTFNKSMTTASWGWAGGRSDGGVYRAPPDEWEEEITIEPNFNKDAASYPYPAWEGEGTTNQVERWIVRSGDEDAHALNMYEDVKIMPGTCGEESEAENQIGGDTQSGDDDSSGLRTIVSGPGFGIVVAVVALAVTLLAAIALRRR